MFYVESIILREDIEIEDDAKETKIELEEIKDLIRQNPKVARNNPKPFLKKMGLLGMPDKILDDIKASLDKKDYAGAERHIVKMTRYIRNKTKYSFMHRFTALVIEAYKKAPVAEKNKIYAAVKSLETKKPIIREDTDEQEQTAPLLLEIPAFVISLILIFFILIILRRMTRIDRIEGFKYFSIKSWIKCISQGANKWTQEGRFLRAAIYVILGGILLKSIVLLPFKIAGAFMDVMYFQLQINFNKILEKGKLSLKRIKGTSGKNVGST